MMITTASPTSSLESILAAVAKLRSLDSERSLRPWQSELAELDGVIWGLIESIEEGDEFHTCPKPLVVGGGHVVNSSDKCVQCGASV